MKKLFVAIICLFSVWVVMTACDDSDDPDTWTLSGDITAQFNTGTPADTATIALMSDSNCAGIPVYSTTTNEWRTTKFVAYDTLYASYEISGIEEGTYYLCGSTDEVNIASYVPYGPAEINISDDTVHDFQLY